MEKPALDTNKNFQSTKSPEKLSGNENSPENTEGKNGMRLKREIGLLEAVAITIGSIIGSGIFISPKGIVAQVHSVGASLVIWVVTGMLSMLGAFCFAELGTTFPSAGGQYTYILEAFGPLLAFLNLWIHNLMFVPIANAVTGLVFAKYIAQPFFPVGCEIPDASVQLLAASAICLLSFINCCDIRFVNKFIDIFMFLKLTAILLIIFGGGLAIYEGRSENFQNLWSESNISTDSLVFSIFAGSWAFGGWQAMSTMMEELKDPYRNLPRAISISLFLVTVIYLLANVAYFAVLSPVEMIVSDAVAVTFVNKLIGPNVAWIVPVFVAISTFGFLSIHIMTNSRTCFVGARNGHFPTILSLITTTHHTPASSIIFQSVLSLVFLYTSDVFALINFGAIVHWFFILVCVVALIYLRCTKPELNRPFKIPLIIPIFYLIISMIFFVIPIWVSPVDATISIFITLTGIPVYYLLVNRDRQSKKLMKISECCTIAIQKLLMLAKED